MKRRPTDVPVMSISTLIEHLQAMQKQYGNLPVTMFSQPHYVRDIGVIGPYFEDEECTVPYCVVLE